jgi:hypothetical protein
LRYETVTAAGPPVAVEDGYSDYRDVGGIKIPFRVDISQTGNPFANVTVTEYRVNSGLRLEDLEKP